MGVDAQMLVRTRVIHDPQQVRRLSVDLAEAFGHKRFWIGEDWPVYDAAYEKLAGTGRHALQIIERYTQDGDDILPEPGEQFIECYPATRYYGEGYERGDLSFLIAVAEWLEHRIPDARIYYGGDSSGICAEPFDRAARADAFRHFATVGHRPYAGGFASVFGSGAPPVCGFCDYAMTSCGGGRGTEFLHCAGCGKRAVRSAGAVHILDRKCDEFFGWEKHVVQGQSP